MRFIDVQYSVNNKIEALKTGACYNIRVRFRFNAQKGTFQIDMVITTVTSGRREVIENLRVV